MKRLFLLLLIFSLFFSCKEKDVKVQRIFHLIKEWENREILFPNHIVYTRYGTDTLEYSVPKSDYTIVSYIDSVGCATCKLQLHRWVNI